MLKRTIIETEHSAGVIRQELTTQGYYLANTGQVCSHDALVDLVECLGGLWQQMGRQTIAPVNNARFIAQTTEAIPPHNECAYAAAPPRYLLLHCRENEVSGGDFYLIDSMDVIKTFTQAQASLLYYSQFQCLIDPAHPQQVTLLKQQESGWHLQFTCIGHSEDWLANRSYVPVAPLYQGYEHIIPLLQQQLKREELRQRHAWQPGDLLIFDNQRYLHGRDVFSGTGRCLDHIRIN
ncbi:MAG: TauD/TfdA dioxygenase family protein [Thiolinea sp.]